MINIASFIDHTVLKTDTAKEKVEEVCREALEYRFASVCVNPYYVPLVAKLLKGSGIKTCSVVGFPLGATTMELKATEAAEIIKIGAEELDMVLNVGALKSGDLDCVRKDMEAVANAARGKAVVKVIIESGLLTDDEKVKACVAAKEAGVDFVKTCTGFGTGSATVEDIRLMRKTVGDNMGVKASGGIRDYETALAMINAGANRLGTSASVAIVKSQRG